MVGKRWLSTSSAAAAMKAVATKDRGSARLQAPHGCGSGWSASATGRHQSNPRLPVERGIAMRQGNGFLRARVGAASWHATRCPGESHVAHYRRPGRRWRRLDSGFERISARSKPSRGGGCRLRAANERAGVGRHLQRDGGRERRRDVFNKGRDFAAWLGARFPNRYRPGPVPSRQDIQGVAIATCGFVR